MLIGSSLQLHFFLMLQHDIKELQNYPFPTCDIQIHTSTQTSVHNHTVFFFFLDAVLIFQRKLLYLC